MKTTNQKNNNGNQEHANGRYEYITEGYQPLKDNVSKQDNIEKKGYQPRNGGSSKPIVSPPPQSF